MPRWNTSRGCARMLPNANAWGFYRAYDFAYLITRALLHVRLRRRVANRSSPLFELSPMNASSGKATWKAVAIVIGRLIFAGIFIMAATFKFLGMESTASYIAAAGFPFP